MKLPFVISLSCVLFTGCNILVNKDEIRTDTTARPKTTHVEVYKENLPNQKYTVIAEMIWSGPRSDELRAERYFIQRAQKLGANAILFGVADVENKFNSSGTGIHTSGLGAAMISSATSTQWLFKSKAIVYDPKS